MHKAVARRNRPRRSPPAERPRGSCGPRRPRRRLSSCWRNRRRASPRCALAERRCDRRALSSLGSRAPPGAGGLVYADRLAATVSRPRGPRVKRIVVPSSSFGPATRAGSGVTTPRWSGTSTVFHGPSVGARPGAELPPPRRSPSRDGDTEGGLRPRVWQDPQHPLSRRRRRRRDTLLRTRAGRLASSSSAAAAGVDEARRIIDEGLAAPRRESFFCQPVHGRRRAPRGPRPRSRCHVCRGGARRASRRESRLPPLESRSTSASSRRSTRRRDRDPLAPHAPRPPPRSSGLAAPRPRRARPT